MKSLRFLAFCTALIGVAPAHAGTPPEPRPQALLGAAAAAYQETSRRPVTTDGEAATLVRHERRDGAHRGLGGEHFNLLVTPKGQLKGFTHMSLALAGRPLPSRERTEQVARAWLSDMAPDLLPGMRISWIEPHDETIQTNGGAVTLSGMKMKARNRADGRWFWVIVGADERPMVFERDIVWITMPGRRQTEKWLHDDWLREQAL